MKGDQSRFDAKIVRAARSEGIHRAQVNSAEGKKIIEEYEYFAKLRYFSVTGEVTNRYMDKQKKWAEVWGEMKAQMTEEGKFFIFGEEGMGKGVRVGKTGQLDKNGRMQYGNEGMDVYNDRITVIRNGKIVEFNRANLDSTRYSDFHYYEKTGKETWKEIDKGRYDSLKEGRAKIPMRYDGVEHYGTIAPGIYKASPMKGREFSMDFEIAIEDNGRVPALNGYNPAYPQRKPGYLEATRIHLGGGAGASWNYSEGCQTIFADDYKEFMELFWDNKLNDGKGGYRYDLVGYYFLLTQ